MKRIIISGGPGAGKSSLVDALAKAGFSCMPEVSRELIRAQVVAGSTSVPWIDLAGFAQLCLEKMILDFESAEGPGLTFFDRGIPDVIAYLRFGGLVEGRDLMVAAEKHRYVREVFIAPPWEEIYIHDDERWQTFAEATALCREIKLAYEGLGYRIIELPKAPVSERVEFTLTKLERLEVN